MKTQLKIDVPIRVSKAVTDITFSDSIEVSLDCSGCKRCHRTVVLHKLDFLSYCTPTKHKFKGKILEITSTKSKIVTGQYLIEYEFEQFEDAKYPQRIPLKGSSWARVKFIMRCKCGANVTCETQNNQVRPFEILCDCGVVLATEVEEIPLIHNESK